MPVKKILASSLSRYAWLIIFLSAALIFSLFLALSLGSVNIELTDTYRVIFNKLGLLSADRVGQSQSVTAIVWNVRFPRVILGVLTGVGLSLCGSVMQSTVNNPIADPYILGISAGATFGATLSIILGLESITGLGAFLGAAIATAAVLFIAAIQRKMTVTSLVLSGMVVNALFIAFSNFMIAVGGSSDSVLAIKFWTMGSLAGSSWSDLVLPTIAVSLSFLFFWTQYRVFNAMMMGTEAAVTLGLPLRFYWYLYISIIAAVTAVLVASCGIIGFVGLITPHIARFLVGTNHLRLFPVTALLGALFVLWADVFARISVKNADLPIGVFTALVGAPFFVFIMIKSQKGLAD